MQHSGKHGACRFLWGKFISYFLHRHFTAEVKTFGETANGKQGKCGHTCHFWLAEGRQKCLLGSLPKPGSLGQNVPKRLAASPPLSRRFLIAPPAFQPGQMIDITACH